MKNFVQLALLGLLVMSALFSADLFASVGTGGGLPYEGPLANIRNSFTGPIAFTLSILGLIVCGASLIFGGDMNGFVRGFFIVVLVISLLVAAQNILATLFGRGALMVQQQQHVPDAAFSAVIMLVLIGLFTYSRDKKAVTTHQ